MPCDQKQGSTKNPTNSYTVHYRPYLAFLLLISLSQLQTLISSILWLPSESAPLIGYADPRNTSFDIAFISLRCIKKVLSIYLQVMYRLRQLKHFLPTHNNDSDCAPKLSVALLHPPILLQQELGYLSDAAENQRHSQKALNYRFLLLLFVLLSFSKIISSLFFCLTSSKLQLSQLSDIYLCYLLSSLHCRDCFP
jgi:hypothetical protein